jgi:hypothetical protein
VPATLRRFCQEPQDTFTKAHDSVVQVYGEGDRETFERYGDHRITKRDPADKERSAGWPGDRHDSRLKSAYSAVSRSEIRFGR